MVSIDDQQEDLHGLFKESLERQQISPRTHSESPSKTAPPREFMLAAGAYSSREMQSGVTLEDEVNYGLATAIQGRIWS